MSQPAIDRHQMTKPDTNMCTRSFFDQNTPYYHASSLAAPVWRCWGLDQHGGIAQEGAHGAYTLSPSPLSSPWCIYSMENALMVQEKPNIAGGSQWDTSKCSSGEWHALLVTLCSWLRLCTNKSRLKRNPTGENR